MGDMVDWVIVVGLIRGLGLKRRGETAWESCREWPVRLRNGRVYTGQGKVRKVREIAGRCK